MNQNGEGLFPVLIIEDDSIKCRALIDFGAGSSYVSVKLIELLRMKPSIPTVSQSDEGKQDRTAVHWES